MNDNRESILPGGVMSEDELKRISSLQALSGEIISINGKLANMATSDDLHKMSVALVELREEVNNNIYKVARESAREAVGSQHKNCLLQMRANITEAVKAHEEAFHKRTSQAPHAENSGTGEFWKAVGSTAHKWLPWFILILMGGERYATMFLNR